MNPIVIQSPPVVQLIRSYNISADNMPFDTRGNSQSNPYSGRINQADDRDHGQYQSRLGTPVIMDLLFKASNYIDFVQNRQFSTDEVRLETVLCTVTRPSIIVKTQIEGRNGKVKEYIGKDDFSVQINGIIAGENGRYPEAQALALQRVCNAPIPLEVVSRYLNTLGIYNLIVEDFSFPQEAGRISQQSFTINAISDEPVLLQML